MNPDDELYGARAGGGCACDCATAPLNSFSKLGEAPPALAESDEVTRVIGGSDGGSVDEPAETG